VAGMSVNRRMWWGGETGRGLGLSSTTVGKGGGGGVADLFTQCCRGTHGEQLGMHGMQ
jgi:hypothetical protein